MTDPKDFPIFMCGSPWGIGSYTDEDGETWYGYPPKNSDPNLYVPDIDCCLPQEIEAWNKAKEEWNKNGSPNNT